MRARNLSIGLLLAWGAFGVPAWGAVTKTVQTQGHGVVHAGDTVAAYVEAKNQALRQAVEQGVGVLVSGRTRVANFALLEDDIYSRTAGFVRQYEVVGRKLLDAGTYWVEVRAEVDLGGLESRLQHSGQLALEVGAPRLVCLGDSALAHRLANRLQPVLTEVEVYTPANADFLAAAANRGDIVIQVEQNAAPLPPAPLPFSDRELADVGLYSVEINSGAKAYWRDSGESITTLRRTDLAVGPSPESARQQALATAADSLADGVHRQLTAAWRTILYDGRSIAVEAQGTPAALQAFGRAFGQEMASIRRLEPQRVEADKATYRALSRVPAFAVAREFSAKGLRGYDVEIIAVTANTLQVRLEASPKPSLGLRP